MTPPGNVLRVAGIDVDGLLHWSEFGASGDRRMLSTSVSHPAGFCAVCLASPTVVVAATRRNEVHRFGVSAGVMHRLGEIRLENPSRIAALVPDTTTGSVFAVLADGSIADMRWQ